MHMKIALAGNPNCGKTTLFNDLTGSNQYVGNWPGVTVEKKEGRFRADKEVLVQDLPGIYSLSPYSLEEVVSRTYLVEEEPDAILNIVDGTNIERNLYLTTQLLEVGAPTLIAVNMMDIVKKNGDKIDLAKLSATLGCEVVGISALKKQGGIDACRQLAKLAAERKAAKPLALYDRKVEDALVQIETAIKGRVPEKSLRWYAVKVFERDTKILAKVALPDAERNAIEKVIKAIEKEEDDDAESIITNQRYAFIKKLVEKVLVKNTKPGTLSLSDKIDKVVTNRILALPIFAVIIWFMYYVAVTTVGSWMTDWANDGLFGDGWHLAYCHDTPAFCSKTVNERNEAIAKEAEEAKAKNAGTLKAAGLPEDFDAEAEGVSEEDAKKYEAVKEKLVEVPEEETWESVSGEYADAGKRIAAWGNAAVAAGAAKWTPAEEEEKPEEAKADDKPAAGNAKAEEAKEEAPEVNDENVREFKLVITDEAKAKAVKSEKVLFEDDETGEIDHEEVVDYEAYLEAVKVAEPNPSDYGIWIPGIPALAGKLLDKIEANDLVRGIVNDAIIGGVGTVFGFVPQICIVFLFLAFLEDCGYMARIAFIMDRIFRKFGLSGKSFIPMLVGMGCGVPAVMATRTIESQRDRRMTITLGTYIPCGAKAAIIAMFVPCFFGNSAIAASSMYFMGIAVIIFAGIALKKTKPFLGDPAPFVMELPAYHMPTFSGVMIHTWERAKGYMIKAGTIIFAACTVLWLLKTFNWSFHMVELEDSMLASIGNTFSWIFAPLGFGDWKGAVASVTAFIAKEEATATLAMLAPDVAGGTLKGVHALFEGFGPEAAKGALASLAAMSFMVFNMFDPPCLVAMATTYREMGSWKWGLGAIAFQFVLGYSLALIVYQLGGVSLYGQPFGAGAVVAVLLVLAMLWFIVRPVPGHRKA